MTQSDRPQEVLLRMFDEAAPWPSIRAAIRAVLKPEAAALPTTPAPSLDAAWAVAEAALPEHDVIKRLERETDGRWHVWTGVPDLHSPTADYGYGPGKGDGGWGGDWAEGPTPAAALTALAGKLRSTP